MKQKLAVAWGLAGVTLLLSSAVWRLGGRAWTELAQPLHWYHWAALILVTVFMAYSEGYKGFQKGFSPRVAARARYLAGHAGTLEAIFAPLFLLCYFGAPRRRKITAISVTLAIIVLIVLVRRLPAPWRGIVDVGVVVGLTWGLLSLAIFTIQAFWSPTFETPPEVCYPAAPDQT